MCLAARGSELCAVSRRCIASPAAKCLREGRQIAKAHAVAPKGGANFDLEDAPLSSTLDLISDWAHVEFGIDAADMDHKVTMNLRNATLTQVLDATFLP